MFPNTRGRAWHQSTLSRVAKKLKLGGTLAGMRRSLSSMGAGEPAYPERWRRVALPIGTPIVRRQQYAEGDETEAPQEPMEAWNRYLDTTETHL